MCTHKIKDLDNLLYSSKLKSILYSFSVQCYRIAQMFKQGMQKTSDSCGLVMQSPHCGSTVSVIN